MSDPPSPRPRPGIGAVAALALRTGLLAFGGGFAVVSRVRRSVVEERRWIDENAFVEHLAVASALPGTNATNLIIMLSHRFAGVRGAIAAAVCYITPSALMMIAFGAAYDRMRGVAAIDAAFEGLAAAVVGLVASIAYEMRKGAIKRRSDWLFAIGVAVALSMQWLSLLSVVAIAAALGVILSRGEVPPSRTPPPPADAAESLDAPPPSRSFAAPIVLAAIAPAGAVLSLFLGFAKISVATFGGGFAMIPALAHESVSQGWVDERAFADAIALGQITPGPVAISATFIGFRVAGIAGAAAATLGIFLPPAILAILAVRSLARFRTSKLVQGALRGVSPAVVGIIAAASFQMWAAAAQTWVSGAIAVVTLAVRVAWPRSSPLIPLFAGGCVTLGLRLLAIRF